MPCCKIQGCIIHLLPHLRCHLHIIWTVQCTVANRILFGCRDLAGLGIQGRLPPDLVNLDYLQIM